MSAAGTLDVLDTLLRSLEVAADKTSADPEVEEVGRVTAVTDTVVRAQGLKRVRYLELVIIEDSGSGTVGLVMDILPDSLGIAVLKQSGELSSGAEITRTRRVLEIPVGPKLTGRIIDPLGMPKDGGGTPESEDRMDMEREAPPIMHRDPVTTPLQTGLKVIDGLFPIGRGQRELILGDRRTGKTAVALDTIINQKESNVICIYCAMGQRSSDTAKAAAALREHDAMDYTVVIAAEGDDPPGLQYAAPYAAAAVGEYFMHQGRDVLVVLDDLTKHARAYRELSLLFRRPPGREAFPGDIFYIHSRLLERFTHLRPEHGGGTMTCLPIIETQAQNLSAYIPTNLISITDGQIYLSPDMFRKNIMPAVDVSKSVSRVGGKAQLPAYRKVAGDLRLSYSQFEELETFARFGTRLDEDTRKTLDHGRRVREILKQNRFSTLEPGEQIAALFAVVQGYMDDIPLEDILQMEEAVIKAVREQEMIEQITDADKDSDVWKRLGELIQDILETQGDKD